MTFRTACIAILGMALTACQHTAPSTVVSVADLFHISSESVTFPIGDDDSVDAALTWMTEDAPSAAQVACQESASHCQEVIGYLQKNAIPYDVVDGIGVLKLTYQRVTAKECTSGMGCSTSRNTIQTVSDYGQFFNPAVLEPQDAADAVKAYNTLYKQD